MRLKEHQITLGRAEEAHDRVVVAWPHDRKRVPFTELKFVCAVARAFHNERRREVASAGDFEAGHQLAPFGGQKQTSMPL